MASSSADSVRSRLSSLIGSPPPKDIEAGIGVEPESFELGAVHNEAISPVVGTASQPAPIDTPLADTTPVYTIPLDPPVAPIKDETPEVTVEDAMTDFLGMLDMLDRMAADTPAISPVGTDVAPTIVGDDAPRPETTPAATSVILPWIKTASAGVLNAVKSTGTASAGVLNAVKSTGKAVHDEVSPWATNDLTGFVDSRFKQHESMPDYERFDFSTHEPSELYVGPEGPPRLDVELPRDPVALTPREWDKMEDFDTSKFHKYGQFGIRKMPAPKDGATSKDMPVATKTDAADDSPETQYAIQIKRDGIDQTVSFRPNFGDIAQGWVKAVGQGRYDPGERVEYDFIRKQWTTSRQRLATFVMQNQLVQSQIREVTESSLVKHVTTGGLQDGMQNKIKSLEKAVNDFYAGEKTYSELVGKIDEITDSLILTSSGERSRHHLKVRYTVVPALSITIAMTSVALFASFRSTMYGNKNG